MITLQDFSYAIRLLTKKPAFTLLTILVMAVGIGLSVFQFSMLHTMAYKDLDFKDGGSIVIIRHKQDQLITGPFLNIHDFHELREGVRGLKEITAYKDTPINVSGRDGARRYQATYAEPNIFELTRTQPILGRGFTQDDNLMGSQNVVVISYRMWQGLLGGAPNVLEQNIRINGEPTKVIGVMPEGYAFPMNAEAWLPLRKNINNTPRSAAAEVGGLAHILPDANIDSINQQLDNVMRRQEKKYPSHLNGVSAVASTIPMTSFAGGGESILIALYVVSVLLLLLASINVGNLLLSRAIERNKETAIRVALGAPRAKLISQMLAESIIICGVGGLLGFLTALWGLDGTEQAIISINNGTPVYWLKFGLDIFTVKIFFAFLIFTIFVTGFLPAWTNSNSDFNKILRDGTRGALSKASARINKLLVSTEVFLSITVLIVASVIVTGTYLAVHVDFGVNTQNKLTANIELPISKYPSPIDQITFSKKLQVALDGDVNISSATMASTLPGTFTWAPNIAVDGKEYANASEFPRANYVAVMPNFFESLGVKLVNGRAFDHTDEGEDKRTVIVTESFEKQHFGDESALGKRVRIAEKDGDTPRWLTIVGVVSHTAYGVAGFPGTEQGTIFSPQTQSPRLDLQLALTMASNEKNVTTALRNTLKSLDPDLAVDGLQTYEVRQQRITFGMSFVSKIFIIFSIAATVLAASGIYGVMANTVTQRTQETGVKRALGASEQVITRAFLWLSCKQVLWGAIPGALAGAAVGFAITQLMGINNALLGVMCLLVIGLIGGIVMLATWVPTKAALSMEPSQALRYE